MANEHFFPGEYFPSGLASPYLGASYAPPPGQALDVAAAMSACGLPWADHQLLPGADSAAATAAHFDSALSSLVSSPANGGGGEDDVAIGDLIGRLGSICNAASVNNSCYSTPLSSPPTGAPPPPQLRAYASGAGLESGKLSRVSSSMSLGAAAAATALETSGTETSPNTADNPSMPTKAAGTGAAQKRKASAKGKATETPSSPPVTTTTKASPKRTKVIDGDGTSAHAEEEKPEPPKDYIHVRARRGQATDSHSLAERVRRERISERMKLLQSLVPGCNKITGKALMLDEIINYVQSLQRQVEFLSMKLATMNPQLEPDGARYLPSIDMAVPGPYGPDGPAAAFSFAGGSPGGPFPAHHGGLEVCDAFGWEQDLQSMVNIQGSPAVAGGDPASSPLPLPLPLPHPHGFYGQAATVNHMKAEP